MDVLVTGANGFIGSNLVKKLIEKNYNVYSLVLKGTSETFIKNLETEIIYGDVTKKETLVNAVKNKDLIFHLAAIPSDWWNKEILNVNFNGTKNITELAIKYNVKRILFMSSLVVHGFSNFNGADENTPILDPKKAKRPYIKSKILCEKYLQNIKNDIEIVIIRPGFTIFGPNDLMFTYELCNTLETGKTYAYINKGKAKMCYSYVENLVEGLILANIHEKAAGETFILCDDKPEFTNMATITQLICDKLGIETPKTSIPYWLAYPFVSLYENIYRIFRKKRRPKLTTYMLKVAKYDLYFKCDKAKKLLNYNPKIDLNQAIEKSIDWYLNFKKK